MGLLSRKKTITAKHVKIISCCVSNVEAEGSSILIARRVAYFYATNEHKV